METAADPRAFPLIDLSPDRIRALLLPVLDGAEPRTIERVGEGLVNTIYRVTVDRDDGACALRVYASGAGAFETEYPLLCSLARVLPVPRVSYAYSGGERSALPYLVYRWIDGITLNECRRQTPDALLTLAAPLGRLLARIASTPPPRLPKLQVAARLVRASTSLRVGKARERLGDALADGLRIALGKNAQRLHAIDRSTEGLVHGDLGGRNILVAPAAGGDWDVVGVLDWESASVGSPLWDLGSLFRYSVRYSEKFREGFANAYLASAGELPDEWWLSARLLDSTRLVAILNDDRELPQVFAECRELIESVLRDCDPLDS